MVHTFAGLAIRMQLIADVTLAAESSHRINTLMHTAVITCAFIVLCEQINKQIEEWINKYQFFAGLAIWMQLIIADVTLAPESSHHVNTLMHTAMITCTLIVLCEQINKQIEE